MLAVRPRWCFTYQGDDWLWDICCGCEWPHGWTVAAESTPIGSPPKPNTGPTRIPPMTFVSTCLLLMTPWRGGQRGTRQGDAFTPSTCLLCVTYDGMWGWEVTEFRGTGVPGILLLALGCGSRHTQRKCVSERKKDTEGWRDRAIGREICHLNGHFYGLGELGGSQTAPLLATTQQTPVRCISVWALLSQRERQMYLSLVILTAVDRIKVTVGWGSGRIRLRLRAELS